MKRALFASTAMLSLAGLVRRPAPPVRYIVGPVRGGMSDCRVRWRAPSTASRSPSPSLRQGEDLRVGELPG
jgi:hypothetical protein